MMAGTLARNYAEALFDMIEKKDLQGYLDLFEDFSKRLREERDFYVFLESYAIHFDEKEKVIRSLSSFYKLPHFIEFLLLVVKKHRIPQFRDIQSEFASLCHAELGISEGLLLSASPISEKEYEEICASLSKKLGKKVVLKKKIEPSLIGGVKVQIEGRIYDGSIRNKLLQLEKNLLTQGGQRP